MQASKQFRELFPTNATFGIFVTYMGLFINLGMLITASKGPDGKLTYNPVTVVLCTEAMKLLSAVVIYMREGHSFGELVRTVKQNKKMATLYFVPAGLYAVYNILTYVNLQYFDPTTYFLLLQFRVVVTGVLWQILFKVQLSRTQWTALIILTLGCIVKQYNPSDSSAAPLQLNFGVIMILVQVFCSCFAGVYNEYLLKGKSGDVHLMIQNVFMYGDSIVVNSIILLFKGEFFEALTPAAIATLANWNVVFLIINNTCLGIVVSLFLKGLNSILKTFASALELMFTAFFSWLFFGIPINAQTVVSIFIVSAAIVLYAQKPAKETPKEPSPESKV